MDILSVMGWLNATSERRRNLPTSGGGDVNEERPTFLAVWKEEKLELLYVELPVEHGTLSR